MLQKEYKLSKAKPPDYLINKNLERFQLSDDFIPKSLRIFKKDSKKVFLCFYPEGW